MTGTGHMYGLSESLDVLTSQGLAGQFLELRIGPVSGLLEPAVAQIAVPTGPSPRHFHV